MVFELQFRSERRCMAKRSRLDPSLPNRIRFWRMLRNQTLVELGEQIGLPGPNLSNIETGKRQLTVPVMQRIANALGVTVADLLRLEVGGLTSEEREMIDTFREIPEPNRRLVLGVLESQKIYRSPPDC